MDWKEKWAQINKLAPCRVLMLQPDEWIVEQHSVELGGDGFLGSVCGRGLTPEDAVEDHWHQLTNIEPSRRVVVDAMKASRRDVRWNGEYWGEGKNAFFELKL